SSSRKFEAISPATSEVGPLISVSLANACAINGTLVLYGALAGFGAPLPFGQLIRKGLTIRGWYLTEMFGKPEWLTEAKRFVGDRLVDGTLSPVIAKSFHLSEVIAAHQYLEDNAQVGKVVMTV
ncbi:zinc-binding dehydrogenase, partial [Burkholderia cepacia]|uniref:zinc-binding dehydrogenase n=1 Tax=Burkholderia cepacia TaxID=292 RepID=UPI0026DEFE97